MQRVLHALDRPMRGRDRRYSPASIATSSNCMRAAACGSAVRTKYFSLLLGPMTTRHSSRGGPASGYRSRADLSVAERATDLATGFAEVVVAPEPSERSLAGVPALETCALPYQAQGLPAAGFLLRRDRPARLLSLMNFCSGAYTFARR